jgi:hypothetical protein
MQKVPVVKRVLAACMGLSLAVVFTLPTTIEASAYASAAGRAHWTGSHSKYGSSRQGDRAFRVPHIYVSRGYRPFYYRAIPYAGVGFLGLQCGPVPDPLAAIRPSFNRTC